MIRSIAIEEHLRLAEAIETRDQMIVRGWPLTAEGLLRNADATRRRYSYCGEPLVAISAELTMEGWDLDTILAGPRLQTRRSYAAATAGAVLQAGFDLLASFAVPHYSVRLPAYTESAARHLIRVLGDVRHNPHHVRKEQ